MASIKGRKSKRKRQTPAEKEAEQTQTIRQGAGTEELIKVLKKEKHIVLDPSETVTYPAGDLREVHRCRLRAIYCILWFYILSFKRLVVLKIFNKYNIVHEIHLCIL